MGPRGGIGILGGETGIMGLSILSFIVLLGILIFVHELGHFLVAKYSGVGVLKFSLGFGPRLVGKKYGETEYLLSLIPLGGYVKLLGESDDDELSPEDRKRSFLQQPVWVRMAIVAAGPLFNFLLAIVIFFMVFMSGVPVLTSQIGSVQEGSAAAAAGLLENDTITAIDGRNIDRWNKLAEIISESEGKVITLTILRGDRRLEVLVQPKEIKTHNVFGEEISTYKIGISPSKRIVVESMNPLRAAWESLIHTWTITKLTLMSIVKLIQGVLSPRTLGGPILIAQIASAQVKEGLIPFVMFMGLLSINLAVLNLLPIPVLDGGHLLFFLIELVKGSEVNIRWREWAQQVGFAILILLMIFVVIMDVERLNIGFFNDIGKYFIGK